MMHDRPFMRKSFAPVRVGDVVDLTIEAVGEKGDGVAKVKGFVIFVPKAKQGETLEKEKFLNSNNCKITTLREKE